MQSPMRFYYEMFRRKNRTKVGCCVRRSELCVRKKSVYHLSRLHSLSFINISCYVYMKLSVEVRTTQVSDSPTQIFVVTVHRPNRSTPKPMFRSIYDYHIIHQETKVGSWGKGLQEYHTSPGDCTEYTCSFVVNSLNNITWFSLQNKKVTRDSIYCKTQQWKILLTTKHDL